MQRLDRGACAWSGAVLGLAGMILFGVYHWIFVAPVIAVFIEGILWGGGAGALVGLAYYHAVIRVGAQGGAVMFGAIMVGALLPYELVGVIWGPFAEITRPSQILPMLPVTLLGPPVIAAAGWWWTKDRRATTHMVVAGFLLHFFIGGSAAHFGGRGQTLALVVVMGAFEFASALLLGPLAARFSWRASSAE